MSGPWRRLALAAAFCVTVGVGVAGAQTVIVRSAPPGSNVDLVFNTSPIGSGTADEAGTASVAIKRASEAETDVHFYVDACGNVRRVILVERGLQPAAPLAGCDRREVPGFFVMRRVTTFVVDLAGATPVLWLSQGPAPREWLGERSAASRGATRVPKGLVVFGGGGLGKFRDATATACGDVSECSSASSKVGLTAGAAYWITPFLAAEASYMRPAKLTVDGTGNNFTFNSVFDTHVITAAANVGVPAGAARIYGLVGMNYHRATTATTETINAVTITVDGVPQTIQGGTQSFELQTSGFSWLFGGGVEAWVRRSFAIYAEAGYARLKGGATNGGEGGIDDRLTFILFGARVHLGR